MKRVVVTGTGIVSSIGNNTQEVLASLRAAARVPRVAVPPLVHWLVRPRAALDRSRYPSHS